MSSRVYRLRAPRRDHGQQPHGQPQHESEATRHQVRTDEGSSMRAIWNCLAWKGMHGMKKSCRWWNVYIGIKPNPKRIDLRCKKCGCRHQYRRHRVSTRGRKSQLRWADFPDNFPPQNLALEANRLNGLDYSSGEVLVDGGFARAGQLQKVVPPVGGESPSTQAKPKLTWWRRLLAFFQRR